MESQADTHDASTRTDATADLDNRALHIGTPNAAGLFYAACSRGYAQDVCGCPICRTAAQDHASRSHGYDGYDAD